METVLAMMMVGRRRCRGGEEDVASLTLTVRNALLFPCVKAACGASAGEAGSVDASARGGGHRAHSGARVGHVRPDSGGAGRGPGHSLGQQERVSWRAGEQAGPARPSRPTATSPRATPANGPPCCAVVGCRVGGPRFPAFPRHARPSSPAGCVLPEPLTVWWQQQPSRHSPSPSPFPCPSLCYSSPWGGASPRTPLSCDGLACFSPAVLER